MRPDTRPRRVRPLLLAVITALVLSTGFVAVAEPAHAAAKPAKVKGVRLKKPRVDGTTASFKVKWKRAARATSYKVKWTSSSGKAHKDRTSKTKMTISNLSQGADYCVKVRAYNGTRKGKWSKTVCRTTAQLPLVQPVWVDAQQVQGASVAMTFRWNEVPGATSYELAYVKGENDIQKDKDTLRATVGASGTGTVGISVGGLEPGKTYCFQVRPSGPLGVGAFATAGCKVTSTLNHPGGTLHVDMMTWNICSAVCDKIGRPWDPRKDAAKARLAAMAPDAVALQEAQPGVDDLATTPGYEEACRVGDGARKNPAMSDNWRHQSLLIKTAKFEVVKIKNADIPPTMVSTSNGIRFTGFSHGGCWVEVRDKVTDRHLILASVHLAPPAKASESTRGAQMDEFRLAVEQDVSTRWIPDANARPSIPIVYAGDVNSNRARSDDQPRAFMNAYGWEDAFDIAETFQSLPYFNSWNNWLNPPPQSWRWGDHVDRVFTPPGSRVTSWRMESAFANGSATQQLSDHSPVRVEVDIL